MKVLLSYKYGKKAKDKFFLSYIFIYDMWKPKARV